MSSDFVRTTTKNTRKTTEDIKFENIKSKWSQHAQQNLHVQIFLGYSCTTATHMFPATLTGHEQKLKYRYLKVVLNCAF